MAKGAFDFSAKGGFDFSNMGAIVASPVPDASMGGCFDFSNKGSFDFGGGKGCKAGGLPKAWAKGGGKGGGGGKCGKVAAAGWGKGTKAEGWKPASSADWMHVNGIDEALTTALMPIAQEEISWAPEELFKKVKEKMLKAGSKWLKDERIATRATASQAKALIDEFVENVMFAVAQACHEKLWFNKVDWKVPLLPLVAEIFRSPKVLCRIVYPALGDMVQDALFKWQEEERIQKVMADTIEVSGCVESHQKKANVHLKAAYDEAFSLAPYGTTQAPSADVALLQDFMKGWMSNFVSKAWNVLENGVGGSTRDDKIIYTTTLFQNLCSPDVACVPFDVATQMAELPPAPWGFIATAVEEIFVEVDGGGVGGPAKKQKFY